MPAQANDALLQAAGFVGVAGKQAIESAQSKGAIQHNQLDLAGAQERDKINSDFETRGMFNSSDRQQEQLWQSTDQTNRGQLIDLGVNDTVADANLSVMQELAQQQIEQEQRAQQKQLFDAEMALKWQELQLNSADPRLAPIDWAAVQAGTVPQAPSSRKFGDSSKPNIRGW